MRRRGVWFGLIACVTAAGACTEPNPAFSGSGDSGLRDGPIWLDAGAPRGTEGGPCYPNNTCNTGLSCVAGTCRRPGADGGPPLDLKPGPDQDLVADKDKDGFTVGDGDCDDLNALINPGAVELEGISCSSAADCPKGGACQGGYCRCGSSADCSSGGACTADEDCSFAGETCIGGACSSSFVCLPPQPGLPAPTTAVCRDGRDNDCNGKTDELPTPCDAPSKLKASDPHDHVRAVGLCGSGRTCGPAAPCPGGQSCRAGACSWVTGAAFNSGAEAKARAIVSAFAQGGPFSPREGQSLTVLSTGLADYDPQKTCPQAGTAFTGEQTDPDPAAADPKAYDAIELTLQLQVPSNARSLELHFNFFSTEYPEFQYLDTFWVQLESAKHTGNIAFDAQGTPVRIDSALLHICDPDPKTPSTTKQCTSPSSLLDGTGFGKDCNNATAGKNEANGGATGWVRTLAPVTPGEVIKLVFSIYDKGDHTYDSTVLIDGLRWGVVPLKAPRSGLD